MEAMVKVELDTKGNRKLLEGFVHGSSILERSFWFLWEG